MTALRHCRLTALIGLALLASGGVSAHAQTQSQDRAEVREILGRAEVESARRVVGEILGNIAGTSRAQAQTTPPANPAPPVVLAPAPATTGAQAADAVGVQVAPAPAAAPATPGTPANPSVIVRIPGAAPTPAGPAAAPVTAAPTVTTEATPTVGAPAPVGSETTSARTAEVSPTSSPAPVVLRVAPAPRVVASPAHRVRHVEGRAWCAPARW